MDPQGNTTSGLGIVRSELSHSIYNVIIDAEQVRAQYPEKTFRTVIPRNVRLSEAPSHGMPITQYDPTSRGGVAYQELTKELIARRTNGGDWGGASRP